jgi:vancomycin aglycone glucosyltransferase
MRVLLAPAGSRGDFQPLLALALGLKNAGHDVRIATAPTFKSECEAFGVPFFEAGQDIKAIIDEANRGGGLTPAKGTWLLLSSGRRFAGPLIEALVTAARDVDVVIGGGAQVGAHTAAEAQGVPYFFVAYTPQILSSSYHPPFTIPIQGLPRFLNRFLWWLSNKLVWLAFGGKINDARRKLGLLPPTDIDDHFFPYKRRLLACDPEIMPPPPDVILPHAPIGSLMLPDERPLPADVVDFLASGPPPVYVGFGSMPDPKPKETTAILLQALKQVGCRALISAGWAGLGGVEMPPEIKVLGPVSHGILFPRVAGTVHHGGAGTTAASARAGKPQLVVPHALDQIEIAARVRAAGLGPEPIPRQKLTPDNLAQAIKELLANDAIKKRAAEVGRSVSERNAVHNAVSILQSEVGAKSARKQPLGSPPPTA